MKEMPEPELYEKSLRYWPYKDSLARVISYVCEHAPKNGTVLDIMCGPGYLLGEIAQKRPDLTLVGVDIDERHIRYNHKMYPGINFEVGDVLKWRPESKFDAVVCTGSLHHIRYDQQEEVVANIASMVKSNGFVIISDPYIDDFSNEIERKCGAAKLGYEYLLETIRNKAPDQVIEWTVDILWNDVLMQEFKTSLKKRLPLFNKYFSSVESEKIWPHDGSEYGDYISFCKPR